MQLDVTVLAVLAFFAIAGPLLHCFFDIVNLFINVIFKLEVIII